MPEILLYTKNFSSLKLPLKYCYLYFFIYELITDALSKIVKVEILLTYNREVFHSNLGHETDYND
jgi:hypothetical protein